MRAPSHLAPVSAVIAVACAVAYPILAVHNQPQAGTDEWVGAVGVIGLVVGLAGVGGALAARLPQNPIGWLMAGAALSLGARLVLEEMALAVWNPATPTGAAWAVYAANVALAANIALLVTLVVLFPQGRAPGRWWRASLWLTWSSAVATVVASTVSPYSRAVAVSLPYEDAVREVSVTIPALVPAGVADLTFPLGLPMVMVGLAGLARIAGLRFRGTTVERLQVRWVSDAVLVTLGLLAAALVVPGANLAAGLVAGFGIPLAIGIAVTRHRLYEIDRVVSRTVTYAVVVGVLAGVYAGASFVLTTLLPVESNLAVAASTLAAAALFTPVGRWVRRVVDRRFNRTHYVAERELDSFRLRLRDGAGIEEIEGDLLATIHRTLEPAMVGVWLRPAPKRAGGIAVR